MKNVPARIFTQSAHTASITVGVEILPVVNDAIVDAIASGAIHPGVKVFHSKKNFTSELRKALQERFSAAGWRLHFNVGSEVYPGTTIYLYGDEAEYLPHISQPDEERRERQAASRSWFPDLLLERFLKLFGRVRASS